MVTQWLLFSFFCDSGSQQRGVEGEMSDFFPLRHLWRLEKTGLSLGGRVCCYSVKWVEARMLLSLLEHAGAPPLHPHQESSSPDDPQWPHWGSPGTGLKTLLCLACPWCAPWCAMHSACSSGTSSNAAPLISPFIHCLITCYVKAVDKSKMNGIYVLALNSYVSQ